MDPQARAHLKRYFMKFPTWAVVSIVAGALLAVPTRGFAVILVAAGIWALALYIRRPTDAEIDGWIEHDRARMKERALVKLGLDPSEQVREAVLVTGPRFWNIGGADVGIKRGKDNLVRYMPVGITVINFTQHQLVAYQCALDLTTGNPLSESTDEYFYKDIVSVSTQTDSRTFDQSVLSPKFIAAANLAPLIVNGKLQLNGAETFVLTTAGGTAIKVVLSDPSLIRSAGGGNMPTDQADQAVQAVRKMLREKKAA